MAPGAVKRRLSHRLRAALYRTPIYRLSLWTRGPAALALTIDERWPGDPRLGEALLQDQYRFAGETVNAPMPPWTAGGTSAEWQAALHGFAWLADLAAVGGDAAAQRARELTLSWLDKFARWHPIAWRADVMGERLHAWIAHAGLLAPEGGDAAARAQFLRSFARQARQLRRTAASEVTGAARLQALKGLLAALLALDAGDRQLDSVLSVIEREIAAQIRPDGGHIARSPAVQLEVLRHLIDMRSALHDARIEVPEPINAAIERATPMLRFFRHGDGRFALFNDSLEFDAGAIDLVLARAHAKGRPPLSAPPTGFERMQAGKSLVIVDCGVPAPEAAGGHPHAGTLSFEMSYGRERLIVNCGAYRGPRAAWHAALRTTAAHSTLIVGDSPSSEIDAAGRLGRRPRHVARERAEEDGKQWLSLSHDGYKASHDLIHARDLYLAADGEDLRGRDSLTGRAGQGFVIRFHLHPQVQASLTQDGGAVLLRLPSGAGWRLRAEGAVMNLAESIYLGGGELKKTQQVVLDGHVGTAGATVKWAIRREARRAGEPRAVAAALGTGAA